jgi:hypothetical protein
LSQKCNNKPVEKNQSVRSYIERKSPITSLKTTNHQESESATMKKFNLTRTPILSTILLGLVTSANLQAGNLASPSGILQVTVPNGKRVLLATPFVRPEFSRGSVVSSSGKTFTISGATYTPDQFKVGTNNVTPYIFEILDGPNIGFVSFITGNGSNTITVEDTIPTGNPDNSRYVIREDYTVSTLLGPASAPYGNLAAGTTANNADQVSFFNSNGKLETFFRWRNTNSTSFAWYLSVKVGTNWVSVADRRVPYGQGLVVERKAGSPGIINLSGELRSTRLRREIAGYPRFNIVANPNPFAIPLSELGLDMAPGSRTAADSVYLWDTSIGSKGGLVQYYRSSAKPSTWRNSAGTEITNVSTFMVPAGSAVVVQRGQGRTGALAGDQAVKLNPLPIKPKL